VKRQLVLPLALVGLLGWPPPNQAGALPQVKAVEFGSPAAPPSRMDSDGALIEDWGRLSWALSGPGIAPNTPVAVSAVKLDGVIPAAVARSRMGVLDATATAFRSPTFPAGTDVLTVQLKNTSGAQVHATLTLSLPDGARVGRRTVMWGGRAVVTLPAPVEVSTKTREWGSDDDSTPMPGWARPDEECDPAFRNIRAGLNGVPIVYRFTVPAGSAADVVLGFCESHWESAGQRPFVCAVEGTAPVTVDPLARWGRHKPGALLFQARDTDRDGKLVVSVLPGPGAPDPNPILNVIWLFPAGTNPNQEQVVRGRLNALATRMVDVGGDKDQSLYEGGKADFAVTVPANGVTELTFLVGAVGGSAPMPDKTGWTVETLRRAALEVNRDWKEK